MTYSESLNIFSPDGRLIQVEYAHHASDQGSLITAKCTQGAIIICIEQKAVNKNMIPKSKLHKISNNIYFSYSGLSSDAQVIKDKAILLYHNYQLSNDTEIDFKDLVMELGAMKMKYTIEGGKRPFGVRSILFCVSEQSRIFIIEPDGNYGAYKQAALGFKHDKVIFKEEKRAIQPIKIIKENKQTESVELTEIVYNDLLETIRAMSETIKINYKKIECTIITKNNSYCVSEEDIKRIIDIN